MDGFFLLLESDHSHVNIGSFLSLLNRMIVAAASLVQSTISIEIHFVDNPTIIGLVSNC